MNIVIIHPAFTGTLGGAKAVSFGMAEALAEDHEVAHYSEHDESLEEINEHFGYEIPESVEKISVDKPHTLSVLESTDRFTLLEKMVLKNYFFKIAKEISSDYDLIIFSDSMYDMNDRLAVPVIQYVHRSVSGKEGKNKFAPYKILFGLIGYFRLYPSEKVLFNSEYTYQNTHSIKGEPRVVSPPVSEEFQKIGWNGKDDQAIIVGRISSDKRIEEAIDIIQQTDLSLIIAGIVQDSAYLDRLQEKAGEDATFKTDLSWSELRSLMEQSKVGLLCKRGEDFGMVVAEYLKADVLPMVHRSGGPKNIVEDENFMYSSVEEAASKIQENLRNHDERLEYIREQSDNFGFKKFKNDIREAVSGIGK